jgi:hypothetical protein
MRGAALLLALLSVPVFGAGRFQRNCAIFSSPSAIATRVCRKSAGDPVLDVERGRDGFLKVDTGECRGYVRESCLEGVSRGLASASSSRRSFFSVGLSLQGDGLVGKVAGSSDSTQGLGFGAALLIELQPASWFRIVLRPSYQYLTLTRVVSLSTGVFQPTDLEFTHRIPYAGLGGLASFKAFAVGSPGHENEWWAEAGVDWLLPLSGRQTDSSGDTIAFTPQGKPFLGLLGISTRLPLSPSLDLGGFLHAYYNFGAQAGSAFYGTRLGVAVSLNL